MAIDNEAPVSGTIIANTGQIAIPVNGLGSVGLFMALTGVTAGIFNFEASIDSTDGVNGNWFAIPGARSNLAAIEAGATLSATPTYGWSFNVVCFNYFRVRASGGTFGSAALWLAPGERVPPPFIQASGAAGSIVQGNTATGTAVAGNPVLVGGRTTIINATARTDGQASPLTVDGQGRLIVKPFSTNELDWQVFNANATPITTATTTALKGAIATYRQYVTAIQLINTSATPGEIVLQDTTGTPVQIWHTWLPASMTMPLSVEFPTPLRTGSGTASGVSLLTLTAGMSIYWSAQGFIGY